jgi:SHS family lactate transporter-like MFS transporter
MPELETANLEQQNPQSYEGADRSKGHPPAVIAGFSGWLLDAFDFFLVTFCLTAMAHDFHKTDVQIALVITLTMAFRPVGGFLFGFLADRYGRRIPLMINIGVFAVAEIMTGLAPTYSTLLIVRALFGMVMGGNWGVGVSLAMEGAPNGKRGILSGLLQEGYAAGNVLAAVCYFSLFGRLNLFGFSGWRPLFFLGSLPAVALVLFIHFVVKESAVWKKATQVRLSVGDQFREVASHWKLFFYLLLFMTMMLFASHGTQDMYPTFLQRQWHLDPQRRAAITAFAGLAAIAGGVFFGHFSDKWGRRRTIIAAFVLAIVLIPIWAYAPNQAVLITGALLMQFMVQGAWGVIPAHLAELSPDSVRAVLPGFAYQCAGVIAGSVVFIEASYAQRTSYATAMALTAVSVFIMAAIMAYVGRERHRAEFGATANPIKELS